jgi:hypothetical protein
LVGFRALAGQTNTYGTFIDAVALTEVAPVASLTTFGDTLSGGTGADICAYALGDGVLSTLIESNLDAGAIIVRGVAMANVDII